MISFGGGNAKNLIPGVLFTVGLIGCEAPRIDVAGQTAHLTGLTDAIVFRESDPSQPIPPATTDHLGLAQTVRLALQNDSRVRSAMEHIRMAEADSEQARLLPNPILVLDMRFPEKSGPITFETELSEDLISILEKPRAISEADNRLRESVSNGLATVLDLIVETREAYASAQSLDAEIAVAQERESIFARLSDLANKRLKAGEGNRLDLLTFQAQHLQAITDLEDFRLASREQRITLARLIGDPHGPAEWALDPWIPPSGAGAAEWAWIDTALANRPEILARRWELAALGDEQVIAGYSPLAGTTVGSHAEHDPNWRTGPLITVPLPIFDFGQAANKKAQAAYRAALYDLEQERLMAIEETRRAYANCIASQETLRQATEQLLPVQQEERRQTELAYQSGDAILPTLLLAETDLRSTQLKIAELQENVTVAIVHLERAAGGAGVARTMEAPPIEPVTQSKVQTGSPK